MTVGGAGSGDVAIPVGVLAGDTNAQARNNVGDTSQTQANSAQVTNLSNYGTDVNLDGRINVRDTNFVKSYSGAAIHSMAPPRRDIE